MRASVGEIPEPDKTPQHHIRQKKNLEETKESNRFFLLIEERGGGVREDGRVAEEEGDSETNDRKLSETDSDTNSGDDTDVDTDMDIETETETKSGKLEGQSTEIY
ncbi:hypothetical protein CHS0354_032304 [Potamilus streckersoni]|uniref:Uncharacterized protein n=1 Tax=Potamilus streckersoni TaxID=2493646 RepID=A0AAE0VGJ6_9BIVA|nr:hypothetical protein CHS0354_032304 [Potamilus streckersoni]